MYFDSRIVVLDEPTTALSLKEVEKVLSFVRGFVGQDKACIYISHNMNHVHRLAHRVIVMDRGQIAGEHFRDELSLEGLETKVCLAATAERGLN
jgi:simple sugar transport system ATP-binding protein